MMNTKVLHFGLENGKNLMNKYYILHITESFDQYSQAKIFSKSVKEKDTKAKVIVLVSITENSVYDYSIFDTVYFFERINTNYIIDNRHHCIYYFSTMNVINNSDVLIFVDPDMIVNRSINFFPGSNTIIGQSFQNSIRYPFICTFETLKKFSEDYYTFSKEEYLKTKEWMSDMYGLIKALDKNNIEIITINNLGTCNDWNNTSLNDYITHYCQPILDLQNQEIFYKNRWDYTPIKTYSKVSNYNFELINELNKYVY